MASMLRYPSRVLNVSWNRPQQQQQQQPRQHHLQYHPHHQEPSLLNSNPAHPMTYDHLGPSASFQQNSHSLHVEGNGMYHKVMTMKRAHLLMTWAVVFGVAVLHAIILGSILSSGLLVSDVEHVFNVTRTEVTFMYGMQYVLFLLAGLLPATFISCCTAERASVLGMLVFGAALWLIGFIVAMNSLEPSKFNLFVAMNTAFIGLGGGTIFWVSNYVYVSQLKRQKNPLLPLAVGFVSVAPAAYVFIYPYRARDTINPLTAMPGDLWRRNADETLVTSTIVVFVVSAMLQAVSGMNASGEEDKEAVVDEFESEPMVIRGSEASLASHHPHVVMPVPPPHHHHHHHQQIWQNPKTPIRSITGLYMPMGTYGPWMAIYVIGVAAFQLHFIVPFANIAPQMLANNITGSTDVTAMLGAGSIVGRVIALTVLTLSASASAARYRQNGGGGGGGGGEDDDWGDDFVQQRLNHTNTNNNATDDLFNSKLKEATLTAYNTRSSTMVLAMGSAIVTILLWVWRIVHDWGGFMAFAFFYGLGTGMVFNGLFQLIPNQAQLSDTLLCGTVRGDGRTKLVQAILAVSMLIGALVSAIVLREGFFNDVHFEGLMLFSAIASSASTGCFIVHMLIAWCTLPMKQSLDMSTSSRQSRNRSLRKIEKSCCKW